jgi:hypothetical protein
MKTRNRLFPNRINSSTITFQVTYMEKNIIDLPRILEIAI